MERKWQEQDACQAGQNCFYKRVELPRTDDQIVKTGQVGEWHSKQGDDGHKNVEDGKNEIPPSGILSRT